MGASRLLLLIERAVEPIFRSGAAVGKRRTLAGMNISPVKELNAGTNALTDSHRARKLYEQFELIFNPHIITCHPQAQGCSTQVFD
jgi:hypothetical protein